MALSSASLGILAPSPFAFPEVWDQIVISGTRWSGKIDVRGARRAYKWDIKDAPGIQGATQTYWGWKPERFTLVFGIWTDDQYTAWTQLVPLFRYDGVKPGSRVKPVNVYHPTLDTLGITQIICLHIGAVEKMSDDLYYEVQVYVEEYAPPQQINVTQTPPAAIDTSVVPGIPPQDAAEIAAREADLAKQQAVLNGLTGGMP